MFCPGCGNQDDQSVDFCRKCGCKFDNSSRISIKQNPLSRKDIRGSLMHAGSKDPDELTGDGIGSVILGDGFFMVAVILSATHSSVSSLLWLFLLIPAFFFFGNGFSDVLHARQIRRLKKQNELTDAPKVAELPPPRASVGDVFKKSISGELIAVP